MRKVLLSTVLWLVGIVFAYANPVGEAAALKIADNFMRQQLKAGTRGERVVLTRAESGINETEETGIYVFNSENGFVVISADDAFPAVLAYSTGSPYDASMAPPAMKEMLEAYHHTVTSTVKTRFSVPTRADIAPLIQTQWDQEEPYNLLTPNNYPTGCVATATAQIMYYHKWPETFDWDKMKTTYTSTDTGDAVNAVAKLMADVGEKVFMEYGDDESSARFIDACEALRYDFGYSETTEFVERECYTAQAWEELLYNELVAKRPVLFGAQSMPQTGIQGGHAFIIDGYAVKDGTGYFHVNWGWGGSSDDYFLISVLNPKYQYTGGHAGSSGYSYYQYAIIGIQPAASPMEKTTRHAVRYCNIAGDKGSYTRTSTSTDFPSLQINLSVWNHARPEEPRQYDVGIALYKDRERIKILDQCSLKDVLTGGEPLSYNYYIDLTSKFFSLGKDLSNGTYQIRILSRETGKTDWTWAMEAACRYVELTIMDNTMTTATYGNAEEFEDAKNEFTVNSVDVSGSKKVGEPLTLTINVTNKHMPSNSPIFLWGNASLSEGTDKYQLIGGGGTNLDPGETGDLVLEYTPQRGGDFKFILSASSANYDTPLKTFEVSVSGMYLLLEELTVENSEAQADYTNKVDGTTLKGVAKITNYSSAAYDDLVYVRAHGKDDESYPTLKKTYKIAIGETVDVPFSIENLTPNHRYILLIYGKDGDDIYPVNFILNDDDTFTYYYKYVYLMTESTGLESLKADEPDADVYNMQGVRLGKASELEALPKGIYIINKKKVINK